MSQQINSSTFYCGDHGIDESDDLVIIGAGGYGKEVAYQIKRFSDYRCIKENLLGFLDDNPKLYGKEINGLKVLGGLDFIDIWKKEHKKKKLLFVCAISDPHDRESVVNRALAKGYVPTAARYADILRPENVKFGEGFIIKEGVRIGVNAEIGAYTQINYNATIGHDVKIMPFVTISPLVSIGGNAFIGRRVFIGANAAILPGVVITDDCKIGASACVIEDCKKPGTYVGVPAKLVKERR